MGADSSCRSPKIQYINQQFQNAELSLSLLVARIFANHPYRTVATNYLAVLAQFLNRSSYLHGLTLIPGLAHHTGAAVPLKIRFLHQSIVLMAHQVRLYLRHEIHRYNDDDQQGGASKIERHVPEQN